MQKKYDVTMHERTVLCEAIAVSNDTNNPVLAKRIRDDCNYTATLGISGGYYDGPRAYKLQIQFLISPAGRSEWDKNFYELAWKAHKEQGPLPNNCSVADFEKPVDAFIELIQPYRAAPLPAMEAMEHIVNMMPSPHGKPRLNSHGMGRLPTRPLCASVARILGVTPWIDHPRLDHGSGGAVRHSWGNVFVS